MESTLKTMVALNHAKETDVPEGVEEALDRNDVRVLKKLLALDNKQIQEKIRKTLSNL